MICQADISHVWADDVGIRACPLDPKTETSFHKVRRKVISAPNASRLSPSVEILSMNP